MDDYSTGNHLVEKFPSSKGGNGFKPLADYIHSLGLKFGIHIMRGIPRQAAHEHTKILGSNVLANDIADPSNNSERNPDIYRIRPEAQRPQQIYDSIFRLNHQWGVDFIKCDDICRLDMPSAKKEFEMRYNAIQKCGREIVLSLSARAAMIE